MRKITVSSAINFDDGRKLTIIMLIKTAFKLLKKKPKYLNKLQESSYSLIH